MWNRRSKARATCGFSLLAILTLPLFSCGEIQNPAAAEAQLKAAEACRKLGGIAIVNNWGVYQRCDFPLKREEDSKEKKP